MIVNSRVVVTNGAVGVKIGDFGQNAAFRSSHLPVLRFDFRQLSVFARVDPFAVFDFDRAAHVTFRNLDFRREVVFANANDKRFTVTDKPAFVFNGDSRPLDVPVFRQHLTRQQKEVLHHERLTQIVFVVIDDSDARQAQFGELARSVVRNPQAFFQIRENRVLEILAQSDNSVLGFIFVELAVSVEVLVVEPKSRRGRLTAFGRSLICLLILSQAWSTVV